MVTDFRFCSENFANSTSGSVRSNELFNYSFGLNLTPGPLSGVPRNSRPASSNSRLIFNPSKASLRKNYRTVHFY
jgi:hypothetical protein